jgi:hypothetical protein
MASKMVSGTVKQGRRVAATTADRTRNQRAVRGVIELCSDVLPPGTTSLTLEEAQYYVGRQIAHGIDRLQLDDDEHLGRQVELGEERQVRDRAYAELYGLTLAAARVVEIAHGSESRQKLLGPERELPTDPVRLYQTARRCQRWLVESRFELPEGQLEFLRFDPDGMVGAMEDSLQRLGSSLEALPEEEKHSIDSLAAKVRRLQELDQLVGRAARFLEALYDLAGMEFESDRIRQSSHQASRPPTSPAPEETQTQETQTQETQTQETQTQETQTRETPAVTAGGPPEDGAEGQPASGPDPGRPDPA